MGGYNTVCEVLSFDKRALIVPRVRPGREQWIRAERMRALGLIDVLHPDHLSPAALAEWLARDLGPRPPSRDRLDLSGLARIPGMLSELLGNGADPHPVVPAAFPGRPPRSSLRSSRSRRLGSLTHGRSGRRRGQQPA